MDWGVFVLIFYTSFYGVAFQIKLLLRIDLPVS
jgi:hypothetical protein